MSDDPTDLTATALPASDTRIPNFGFVERAPIIRPFNGATFEVAQTVEDLQAHA